MRSERWTRLGATFNPWRHARPTQIGIPEGPSRVCDDLLRGRRVLVFAPHVEGPVPVDLHDGGVVARCSPRLPPPAILHDDGISGERETTQGGKQLRAARITRDRRRGSRSPPSVLAGPTGSTGRAAGQSRDPVKRSDERVEKVHTDAIEHFGSLPESAVAGARYSDEACPRDQGDQFLGQDGRGHQIQVADRN